LFATGVVYTGGKFAAGVVDTVGNLPPALLTPVANLPPVSTTLKKMVEKFSAGVVDNLIPVENLPPVLLIPVVHLDLRISPRIFEKIRYGLNGILWGWGETDS
jgi:hypothetical protein